MALLTARNIRHNFGGLRAIDDFNLDLHQGELMGLIGPNGAGKTTVFNLITGVYRASEGSIRYRDEELVGRTPHEITALGVLRARFRTSACSATCRCSTTCGSRTSPSRAIRRSRRCSTWAASAARRSASSATRATCWRSSSSSTWPGETASSLPYGHQRRLEIARALATRPELLLLDEPAAGMNPSEIDQLMEFIRWIRREFQLTILLIEHQMKLVMGICERIKVLDFGKTLAEGPPEVVRSDPAGPGSLSRREGGRMSGRRSGRNRRLCRRRLHLEVRDLRVHYDGIQAVHGVSFSVRRGEIVTLIGANGAGKTSILRAISGLIPYDGSVTFAGRDLRGVPAHRIVGLGMAHVPEGRGIFGNLTVRENLRLATWQRRDRQAQRPRPDTGTRDLPAPR